MPARNAVRVQIGAIIGLVAGLAFFGLSSYVSYSNIQAVRNADASVRDTHTMSTPG